MTSLNQIFKISLRNVFRNRRRTILTLFILILGSSGLTLVGGFFDYIIGSLGEYFVHSQTGNLQISREHFYERGTAAPFQYLLSDVNTLQQRIESNPKVDYTVPRLSFGGMLSTEKANVAVLLLGVDPARESKMGEADIYRNTIRKDITSTNITAGQDLATDDPYGVLLGRGLMKALQVGIGDNVTLLITRQFGSIDGLDLHVRGEFTTLLKDFDDRILKMNLSTLQDLFNVPGKVHSILVILKDMKETENARKELLAELNSSEMPLEAIPWTQQADYYNQSRDFLNKIYMTVQLIIGIVFFFSIANTINMNLFERMREFGTMMALGNTRGIIIKMILMEGSILGLMGATLGLFIGFVTAKIVSAIGITMPPPPMGSFEYPAYIILNLRIMAQVFFVVSVSTILASIIPAYRASHFRIVAALGHV